MTQRTRIKICGLTRAEDVDAAVKAGADALGFVFYEKSPRYVDPPTAGRLIARMPPFVSAVGLFVNAGADRIAAVLAEAPIGLLQFHGDETAVQCGAIAAQVGRRYLKAIRMAPNVGPADLLESETEFQPAGDGFAGLLLDAYADEYGGTGKGFDWSRIPENLAPRVVLSGGLSAQNAADAVLRVRPWAVDVSSGVELAKGIKDALKIRDFIEQVRRADAQIQSRIQDFQEPVK